MDRPPLPVTFVAGWFGSGKSRIVAEIVRAQPGEVAVIHAGPAIGDVPAWAMLAVEEELVWCSSDQCACCSVRLDLIESLRLLADRRERPSHVVVELGGDADVTAALQTTLRDPDLRRLIEVVGVITALDAPASAHLIDARGELEVPDRCLDHLAVADHVVLTRSSLSTSVAIDRLVWTLHFANRRASTTLDTEVEPHRLLPMARGWASSAIPDDRRGINTLSDTPPGGPVAVRLVAHGGLDRDALSRWMDAVHHTAGADLLRLDGVVAVEDEEHRWIARGARTTLDLADGDAFADGERRVTRLWLVGRGLDAHELGLGLQGCSVSSHD